MSSEFKPLRIIRLIQRLRSESGCSISQIAKIIQLDTRSAYRYIKELENEGFLIDSLAGRYFIHRDPSDLQNNKCFTVEETKVLELSIHSLAGQDKLKGGILSKIYLNSELEDSGESLQNMRLAGMVERLGTAIQEERQVKLINYRSNNSESVRDRLVEPVEFSENHEVLFAYELESGITKSFKLERMEAVKLRSKKMLHRSKHQVSQLDIFGFSVVDKRFPVELRLNLRAYQLLREEFPRSIPYLKQVGKTQVYHLKVELNSLEAISRFVLRLYDCVEVIEGEALKLQLAERLEKMQAKFLVTEAVKMNA